MIFSFLQGNMYVPGKLGAYQRFCAPKRARLASGVQFVQAGICSCVLLSLLLLYFILFILGKYKYRMIQTEVKKNI